MIVFRNPKPICLSFLTARHKALSFAWPNNIAIELLICGNTLPRPTSLVLEDNKLLSPASVCFLWMEVYGYGEYLMNPLTPDVNWELFSFGALVIIRGVSSWCHMGSLIRLETNMIGWSILSDHLYLFMSMVHSAWFKQFQQNNITLYTSSIAQSGFTDIVWILDTSNVHPNSQKWFPTPDTRMDLWNILQDAWCEFHTEYFQTLAESIPRHVVAFLSAPSGHTWY